MNKYFFYLIMLVFALAVPSLQVSAQSSSTYYVIARPSHLIRVEPNIDAIAITGSNPSVVYGGKIQVIGDPIRPDTLEGIPGQWRQVKNVDGKAGYMFDGYLVKAGSNLAASNELGFERHERKIQGLANLLAESEEKVWVAEQKAKNSQVIMWIGLAVLAASLIGVWLYFNQVFKKKLSAAPTINTSGGQLDLDGIVKEITPKISEQLDPKIKKISPNIIDLIQIQLKEFNEKMSREYEKKSHVKTIKIKREAPEIKEEQAPKEQSASQEKIEQTRFGFSDDTELFSAYLHKGYQRRYVELPRNNLFFGRKATQKVEENSVYELYVLEKDPTRALYRMIDDSEILAQALRFPHDYIYPVCEVYGTGNIQEAEQLEYSYGIAVKDGPNWRIIQKAKLRYYLGDQLEEEEVAEKAWTPTGEDTTAILYAVAPKNEAFNLGAASEQFVAGKHVFKITVTEQDKATYELVEDAKSQIKAFHLPNKYLLPAIATLGQGSIYVALRAEMVQAGELIKENGEWKINKKGIIQYFKS